MMPARKTIQPIIDQHGEDASFFWLLRDAAISDPHYSLNDLAELDNRVDANLDGLLIACDDGWNTCHAALEMNEPGEIFSASILAFHTGSGERIDAVIDSATLSPENFSALVSALGWLEFNHIKDILEQLLTANSTIYRTMSIAAHAIHRRDPGEALTAAVQDPDPRIRARALRATGELRRRDLLHLLRENYQSDDEACRFWSAWSAVMLGEYVAVKPLMAFVNFATRYRDLALQLVLRVQNGPEAQNWLRGLLQDEKQRRYVLMGCGITGDPGYVPTLIKQMAVPELARVAGEAFSMITGVDLAYEDLEDDRPADFEVGPTEAPEDENVELDHDEDLPWPNQSLIQEWWNLNREHYQAGGRYLLGEPITETHCRSILRSGYQRQRAAAALELALIQHEQPLFETRAPGFRQQRLLRDPA